MPRIQVLPEQLTNQIAAGEVVERPASVVKELVENSLDAGATRVEIAITEGGIRWISVQDDGAGLSPADARLAFERHATSKIRSGDDLARVVSLGFRGEALPSIAAVGRVRMRTRPRESSLGCEVVGEGRGVEGVSEIACPPGTRVEVAELFGKIPARRKFLKSAATESGHIVRWLERIALARPDLRIALERDGRDVLLFLPTEDERERVIAALPAGLGERLLSVQGDIGFAKLRGFTSPTDVRRGSTNDIHLYVNGRPVRDRFLLFALRAVYRDALPPGRHPVSVLHLEIDPAEVDVNVHPAKWEVRFRQADAIRRLVQDALVRALGLGSRSAPLTAPGRLWETATVLADAEAGFDGVRAVGLDPPFGLSPGGTPQSLAMPGTQRPAFSFRSLRFLGQILETYLAFEGEQGLVLLDQHAAHERVLFERMRATLFAEKLERQVLLLPVWIELARSAADALDAHRPALERAGFELETGEGGVRGGVRVGLRAVPAILAERTDVDWPDLLGETAAALQDPSGLETRDGIEAALHGVLATAACHAATRQGDRLEPEEVRGLLEALDETLWFPNCPHGRPILSVVNRAELERRFLRR